MISKIIRATLLFYVMCSLTAMAPMNLSFLLVILTSITAMMMGQKKKIDFNLSPDFKRYRFWALALLLTCWGSLVVTKFYPYAYADHNPEVTFHGFLKIWYLLVPAVLLYAFEVGSECKSFSIITMIKPWWVVTLIMMVVAVVQFLTGWPHPQMIPDQTHFYHATLFFGHHLSTASIFIFPAFTALAITFGFYTRTKQNELPIPPRLALIIGIAGTLILFLSYARTAWIALVIGFILLFKKYLLPNLSRKQWFSGAILLLMTLGVFVQTPMVKTRIEKLYGISERTELWKANIDFFTHRPLTGIGWLKTQEMSEFYFKSIDPEHYRSRFWGHAHSNIFEMLGGTGLFGLLAFLGWSFFTLRIAHQLSAKYELRALSENGSSSNLDFFYSDFCRGIFIALILLHFNGLTNVTFWEGKVMHQQMLALGMLLILDRMFKKIEQTHS